MALIAVLAIPAPGGAAVLRPAAEKSCVGHHRGLHMGGLRA